MDIAIDCSTPLYLAVWRCLNWRRVDISIWTPVKSVEMIFKAPKFVKLWVHLPILHVMEKSGRWECISLIWFRKPLAVIRLLIPSSWWHSGHTRRPRLTVWSLAIYSIKIFFQFQDMKKRKVHHARQNVGCTFNMQMNYFQFHHQPCQRIICRVFKEQESSCWMTTDGLSKREVALQHCNNFSVRCHGVNKSDEKNVKIDNILKMYQKTYTKIF